MGSIMGYGVNDGVMGPVGEVMGSWGCGLRLGYGVWGSAGGVGAGLMGLVGLGALRGWGGFWGLPPPTMSPPYRDGIAFALQEGPGGGPDGAPLYLPFLEVLAEFSPRLLQSDRALM